jgi:hypothetical protein
LPATFSAREGPGHAQVPRGGVGGVGRVHDGDRGTGDQLPGVERDARVVLTVAEHDVRREVSVDRAGAPTVVIHGATLDSVELPGPAFPAE